MIGAHGNNADDHTSLTEGLICCRGVRGATLVPENTAEAITERSMELLQAIAEANHIHPDDVASIFFTTTPDLTAGFPAIAARKLGWTGVAAIGSVEIAPPGSLDRCIRVLLLWNTNVRPTAITHVYIRGAEALRPDRSPNGVPTHETSPAR